MNKEDAPVEELLEEIGFGFINEDTPLKVIESALKDLAVEARGVSDGQEGIQRSNLRRARSGSFGLAGDFRRLDC